MFVQVGGAHRGGVDADGDSVGDGCDVSSIAASVAPAAARGAGGRGGGIVVDGVITLSGGVV